MASVSQRVSAGKAQLEKSSLVDNQGWKLHETKGDAFDVPILLGGGVVSVVVERDYEADFLAITPDVFIHENLV